ncbi:MAG: hypothetical protein KatS3mg003_0342 [Candidatus Nitrosocaldaceae archaeon]|nr:MAG: hypothetical protein KatS3mg003_0342 [Candidatus Nitrosocaldaceae archaeon]
MPDNEKDVYDEFMTSWLEYLNLFSTLTPVIPSLGMIQTYRKRMIEVGKELTLIYKAITKFNEILPKYDQQIFATWFEATRKAIEKCNKENITDKDAIKKIWIDTLEEEFTELFNSDEFGIVSSKLLNSENDMNRHIARIAEIYSRALNMPTRSEIDDIYGEVTKLKREVKKLSDKLKALEKAKFTTKN